MAIRPTIKLGPKYKLIFILITETEAFMCVNKFILAHEGPNCVGAIDSTDTKAK